MNPTPLPPAPANAPAMIQGSFHRNHDLNLLMLGYQQPGETTIHAISRLALRCERILEHCRSGKRTVAAYEQLESIRLVVHGSIVWSSIVEHSAATVGLPESPRDDT